ncbi:ferritin-like domain-containing protein [Mycena floridula]|nr:ferritin-like domain-containing protein [Mycena floridula]
MRVSSCILALAAPLAALAAPTRLIAKRSPADILVLTFADSDFTAAGFTSATLVAQQLTAIQNDEATHSTILQAVIKSLGAQPLTTCQFNFDSALTDVATMAATARIVEYVGISAYLGGATLIDDPVLLDHAGSILTVEARHQTVLNILSGTGSAVAQAFDIPLAPPEVLAIASPFISGCDLGVPPANTLTITNTGSVGPGTKLTFSSSAINGSTDGLFCQMMVGGAPFSISLPFDQCIVPEGINGGVYQVAGPAAAMIDTSPEMLAQLSRTTSGSANSGESTTTATISPGEASSIIAGASTAAGAQATSGAVGNDSSSPSVSLSATPKLATGPSEDGKITIDGWVNLPPN